ncbi:hypothetical protein Tco_1429199 [Tanacetum coccineum]
MTNEDTITPSPKLQESSPSAPNAPFKTPSTKDTLSSSIDYTPKSPTLSSSPSTNGYLNPPLSPPPRVPPLPQTQAPNSMEITLSLSPITSLDHGSGIETIVYADSNHAGDYVDLNSTSGVCTFMGCCLTSWFSKEQTALAISKIEAEYVSAGKACQQALWMKQALIDYGVRLDDIPIMCDNKGAIDLRFAEIVDFLRGSNLRYALTTNPTIYDSLIRQFWQTATANTKADGSLEITATIDTIRYTISEASIRDSLQLDDATGITMLPNDELFEGMGQIGYPTDGTFTFWKSFFTPQWRYLVHHLLHCISSKSGGWDQFGSNIATAAVLS